MKITKLTTFIVPPRWVFLKIETDEGITGWGEPVLEGRAPRLQRPRDLVQGERGVRRAALNDALRVRPPPTGAGTALHRGVLGMTAHRRNGRLLRPRNTAASTTRSASRST